MLARALRRDGGTLRVVSSSQHRKAHGIFYTPEYVARYIAERCLPPDGDRSIPKMLDPACGCGRFLVTAAAILLDRHGPSAARSIARRLHGSDLDADAVLTTRRRLWLTLLPSVGGAARELAAHLEANIVCGNTLTCELWPEADRAFDLVLGNPPYRRELGTKHLLDAIAATDFGRRYRAPRMDLWYYFLHRGLELLAPDGRLGFIVGAYWASGTGAERLIRTLRDSTHVEEVFQLGQLDVFPGVAGRHMILILRKGAVGGPTTVRLPCVTGRGDARPYIEGTAVVHTFTKTQPQLFRHQSLDLEPPADHLLTHLTGFPQLGQLGTIRQGIAENPANVTKVANEKHSGQWTVGQGVFALTPDEVEALNLSAEEERLLRPYYDLCDLGRYDLADQPSLRLIYSTATTWPRLEAFPTLARHLARFRPIMEARRETRSGTRRWWQLHWPRHPELWEVPKLVALQMGPQPAFVPVAGPVYSSFSTNVFIPADDVHEPLAYFAALLNSRLLGKWFRHHAKRRGVGLEINGHVLARAPIRRIDSNSADDVAACDRLVTLVEQMLELSRARRREGETEATTESWAEVDREIDRLVYRLYDLAAEDIVAIETLPSPCS